MAANAETASPQHSKQMKSTKIDIDVIECQPNSEFKTKFNQHLSEFYRSQVSQLKKPWSMNRILEVIQNVKIGKEAMSSGSRRTSMQYYWNSKYDVAIDDKTKEEYLVIKKKKMEEPTIRIIATEKYFDLLFQVHNKLDHAGRDKITNVIKNKYYVQKKAVELFVALCPTCDQKRSILRKKTATKLATANFNTHGLLDIIDFRATPDGDYKWVLKYQDRATKFVHIRPLKTDKAAEIALELIKIFLTFGAPSVLFCDDVTILNEIMTLWPQCNIFYGGCRSLSADNLALTKEDVKVILHTWIADSGSSNWSLGCYFIQYQINTTNKLPDDKSSYRQLFGADPKITENSNNEPVDYYEVNILTQKDEEENSNNGFSDSFLNNTDDINEENEDGDGKEEAAAETSSKSFSQVFIHQGVKVKTENEEDDYEKSVNSSRNISQRFHHHEVNVKIEKEEVEQSEEETNTMNTYQDGQIFENEKREVNQGVKRPADETREENKKKTCTSDLNIGDTVKISVPMRDWGPSNTQFIIGKVLAFHDGLYQIGTKAGIMKDWFLRHELVKSDTDMKEVIPQLQFLTFKQAVAEESLSKSQN